MISEPVPKSIVSCINILVSTDKGKGKMILILEEPVFHSPKSSIQTTIDLHMEEVDRLAEEEIIFFDDCVLFRTVHHVTIFRTK